MTRKRKYLIAQMGKELAGMPDEALEAMAQVLKEMRSAEVSQKGQAEIVVTLTLEPKKSALTNEK